MANRHCIFAWTETNVPEGFPGYVNISRDENGKHTITVRSRGNAGRDTAIVEIPPEALESLLCDLVPPSAAEWFADSPGIANHDWRGGWDACRNRCRTLLDEYIAATHGVRASAEANNKGGA